VSGRAEPDTRRRLAEVGATLPEDTLAILKHCAEEALTADGVARTRLGYEVLVRLKMDELLEREYVPADVSASHGDPDTTAVEF
jgi:hypothetical protein